MNFPGKKPPPVFKYSNYLPKGKESQKTNDPFLRTYYLFIFALFYVGFQKITHMRRRWGKLQNYYLTFIDELEKQLFIKKTVEVLNFNIYNVVFF